MKRYVLCKSEYRIVSSTLELAKTNTLSVFVRIFISTSFLATKPKTSTASTSTAKTAPSRPRVACLLERSPYPI